MPDAQSATLAPDEPWRGREISFYFLLKLLGVNDFTATPRQCAVDVDYKAAS
jgi:hypothetical protein